MRPGQETPDEARRSVVPRKHLERPSMRPGQETPDEAAPPRQVPDPNVAPSMRPGQETPDEVVHCPAEVGARLNLQ